MSSSGRPQRNRHQSQGSEEASPIVQQTLPKAAKPPRPGPAATSSLVSKDHRHRPSGLWYPPSDVYRLSKVPKLFVQPLVVPTTSTEDLRVAHRARKAWMYCVSTGPCWELLEDRAFFKEEYVSYNASLGQGRRIRPQVYPGISSSEYFKYISPTQAARYVPQGTDILCYMGLFGHQKRHEFTPFSGIPMGHFIDDDLSYVFYVGAPVTAADWCPLTEAQTTALGGKQYIAISTLSEPSQLVPTGLRASTPSPASIQVWSYGILGRNDQENRIAARCEMIMCIEEGGALQVRWCPLPSHHEGESPDSGRLGVLAAVTMDGNLNIYMVLKPSQKGADMKKPSYRMCRPMSQLSVQGTSCLELDWANSETIAVGCANGFIAVFSVKDAITAGTAATLTHLFPCHQTAIQSVCWVRAPTGDADGSPILTSDPTLICSTGTEGIVKVTDTRDCIPSLLVRNREVPHAIAYSTFCGSVLVTDVDFWVKMFQIQPGAFAKGHSMVDIGGAALTISVSDMHPIVAVGSADGACYTGNMLRGTRREGAVPLINHKIFQLDYSPKSDHYRMLDHFLPRESGSSEGPSNKESPSKSSQAQTVKDRFEKGEAEPSGLWHPNIAVTTVRWNSGSGLGCASLLLSGTACGLVRIDSLEGAWIRNTFPYGSIEKLRGEEEDMEEESMSQSESD